ncbi:hypothetical protein GCM10009555_058410 [Acrocarpospora macrocephala]|uniref:eCIS core domain-containing protein n=1 Tax=Acrocarpospora macrocephala TaxID=150177 RepID=A0A5M3WSS1_9ACTN|nr:DUF4157 domain-containing protein [Acrocarpospora macrocephala]GES11934.1 hypothetical protein Amac_055310 [Acrocarpospora macrocephala]
MSWWVRVRRELEADELARRRLAAPGRTPGERELAPLPGAARGTGLELGGQVRGELESRFGVDLTRVRVRPHDVRVRRRGALAEAEGTTISFAPGQYAPHTDAGLGLLAHEIAHVALRHPGRSPRRKPSARPYHQEVVEELRASTGARERAVRPILALCEAVAQERAADLPALVAALTRVDVRALREDFPSHRLAEETTARLILLGRAHAAAAFTTWYLRLAPSGPYPRRYYDDAEWHWQEVLAALSDKIDWSDGAASLRVLDALVALFHRLRAEQDGLDVKELAADRARFATEPPPSFGMATKPYVSISMYHDSLTRIARSAFEATQAAFQAVLERAADALATRRDRAPLDALERRIEALGRLKPAAGADSFEINMWTWRKRRGKDVLRQKDFFPSDKRAARRELTLQPYDATEEGLFIVPSMELELSRVMEIRALQLKALKRVYGIETGPGGARTAEARANERALATLGGKGLRLHGDDDWRRFLRAKFEEHLASTGSADAAFQAVVNLLKFYLRAFTTHSPYNIDDFGDDLLKIEFPRTLTGQLVHDCGVYALRIAFMLSLLKDHPRLRGMRLRFAQLPVHIALVITGAPEVATYIAHNDDFHPVSAEEMEAIRTAWAAVDADGRQRRRPAARGAATDDAFFGELAADRFIPATDMPVRVAGIPEPGDRTKLLRLYRKVVGQRLFGPVTEDPKQPEYQFHLRYLKLLDGIRVHYNRALVPYWNRVARPTWQRHKDALRTADPARFAAAAASYLDDAASGETVDGGRHRVWGLYLPLTSEAIDISVAIDNNPAVLAPRVHRVSADRLIKVLGSDTPWWDKEIREHVAEIKAGVFLPPPFPEGDDPLMEVD